MKQKKEFHADKCSKCGATNSKSFWDYPNSLTLCDNCEKKTSRKKLILMIIGCIIIFSLLIFVAGAYWFNLEYSKAQELSKNEQYNEAMDHLNLALSINPNDENTLILKGMTLYKMGKYDESVALFDKLLSTNSNDTIAKDNKAFVIQKKSKELYNKGDYNKALDFINQSLELNPNDSNSIDIKGIILINLNLIDDGCRSFDKALEIDKNNSDFLSHKAYCFLFFKNDYSDALKYYGESLSINSNNLYALTGKGIIIFLTAKSNNDYIKADDLFDQALKQDNNNILLFNYKGNVSLILGRYDESVNYFNQSLALFPNDWEIQGLKGAALENLGEYSLASKSLDQALSLNPNNESLLYNKGIALYGLGSYEEAIKYFDKSLNINPNNPVTLNTKGNSLSALGKYDEAIEIFDEVLAINPDNNLASEYKAEALNNKAVILFNDKNYVGAMEYIRRALETDPNLDLAINNKEALQNMKCAYNETKINGFCTPCGAYGEPCCTPDSLSAAGIGNEFTCFYTNSGNQQVWFQNGCVNNYCKKTYEDTIEPYTSATYIPTTTQSQNNFQLINNSPTLISAPLVGSSTACPANETRYNGICMTLYQQKMQELISPSNQNTYDPYSPAPIPYNPNNPYDPRSDYYVPLGDCPGGC